MTAALKPEAIHIGRLSPLPFSVPLSRTSWIVVLQTLFFIMIEWDRQEGGAPFCSLLSSEPAVFTFGWLDIALVSKAGLVTRPPGLAQPPGSQRENATSVVFKGSSVHRLSIWRQ